MRRGQQSNYGTTKDRYRSGRGSEEEREAEKEEEKNGVGGVVTCWSLHHAMIVN